jgi:CHAD domain-containing protein
MRIAIRSVRAALRLFGVEYRKATEQKFDSRLRAVGQVFGQERDWNVFCLDTLPGAIAAARSVVAASRLRRLRKPAERQRRAAQLATLRAINGPLLTPLVLQLAAWVDKRSLSSPSSRYDLGHQQLSVLAPLLLNRVVRSAFKRARHVDRLSTDKLHRVRKAVRRLGSDATSLASAFPRRLVKPYKRRCDEVLSILGAISDGVVTRRIANSLIMAHPDYRSAAAIIIRRSQRREATERRTLKGALRALRRSPAFWL